MSFGKYALSYNCHHNEDMEHFNHASPLTTAIRCNHSLPQLNSLPQPPGSGNFDLISVPF